MARRGRRARRNRRDRLTRKDRAGPHEETIDERSKSFSWRGAHRSARLVDSRRTAGSGRKQQCDTWRPVKGERQRFLSWRHHDHKIGQRAFRPLPLRPRRVSRAHAGFRAGRRAAARAPAEGNQRGIFRSGRDRPADRLGAEPGRADRASVEARAGAAGESDALLERAVRDRRTQPGRDHAAGADQGHGLHRRLPRDAGRRAAGHRAGRRAAQVGGHGDVLGLYAHRARGRRGCEASREPDGVGQCGRTPGRASRRTDRAGGGRLPKEGARPPPEDAHAARRRPVRVGGPASRRVRRRSASPAHRAPTARSRRCRPRGDY